MLRSTSYPERYVHNGHRVSPPIDARLVKGEPGLGVTVCIEIVRTERYI